MRRLHIDLLEPRRLLAVIYVDQNSPNGSRDGTSWTKAFKYLQDALAVAQSGDDIRIANGTYKPTTGTNRDATFMMKPGVDLFGGYAGYGATIPDFRNTLTSATTLSGEIGSPIDSDNSKTIITAVSLSSPILIDGIQVKSGYSTGEGAGARIEWSPVTFNDTKFVSNTAKTGSAISLLMSDATPAVISNSKFDSNHATQTGSAIHQSVGSTSNDATSLVIENCQVTGQTGANTSSAVKINRPAQIRNSNFSANDVTCVSMNSGSITGCSFSDNTSWSSPAVLGSRVLVSDSDFSDNVVQTGGGAITLSNRSRVVDCTFTNNSAEAGGAIFVSDSYNDTPTIERCTFTGNVAEVEGGALHGSAIHVQNSIFTGNSAPRGGALYNHGVGAISFLNVTFTENVAQDGSVGYTGGDGLFGTNCILWQNQTSQGNDLATFHPAYHPIYVNYSILEEFDEDTMLGTDNTFVNPRFVELPEKGTDAQWGTDDDVKGDLSIQINSPAIDAGQNLDEIPDLDRDVYGDVRNGSRKFGLKVDIGAYEHQPQLATTLNDGLLRVTGTTASDSITISPFSYEDSEGEFTRVTFNDQAVTYANPTIKHIRVEGNAGKDLIEVESELRSIIFAGDGNDTVKAGAGHDRIEGGAGDDLLYGNTGDDSIFGGDGNDTIAGGAQKDQLYGGAGIDRIGGNGGNDKLYEEADDDRLYGDDGNDYLSGGLRVDRLYGGLGSDTLDGGKSNDKLYGQDGDDRLEGDEGNDLISGGSGNDTAVEDEDDSLVTSIEILI